MILPLSTRAPEIWPLRVRVEARGLKPSYAVLPGIRQVSKTRLHEPIGPVLAQILARIDDALDFYLND